MLRPRSHGERCETKTSLGNFHAAIICNKGQEETARKIIAQIQRRAVQLEGTITGEHGVGLELRDSLVYELGENAVDMMRKVCRGNINLTSRSR